MAGKDYISQLSPYLFWDMDLSSLDTQKNSASLIQRVLEYGQLQDWKLTRNYYGLERVISDCKTLRSLDPKALSFICAISNTSKEEYRCYNFAQSFPTLWNS